MDPYDSDSSFDEERDFTETGVLLGYAADEVIEDTISHLGGWPSWLDDASPPPGDFADCKVCNRPMLLLLELHGDLPEHFPTDERRLYLFGCPRKPCSRKPGSIRAFRATRKINVDSGQVQKQSEEKDKHNTSAAAVNNSELKTATEKSKQDLGASLFGATSLTGNMSNANPFSTSSATSSTAAGSNPFSTPASAATKSADSNSSVSASANALAETFADKVRVSSPPPPTTNTTTTTTKASPESNGPPTPWPAQSDFPAPYQHFYLDAEYETLSRPSTPQIPENVTVEPMDEDGSSSTAELKDTFESELDKAFMKFSTRLAHNPEQVLRYEFRGTPLLYSHAGSVGKKLHRDHHASEAKVTTIGAGGSSMPPCEYCGSERVFELQLVPHAISVLEEGRAGVGLGKDDAGMEWGTIILGVCAKDCAPQVQGQTGWREEWAGVQWEETR